MGRDHTAQSTERTITITMEYHIVYSPEIHTKNISKAVQKDNAKIFSARILSQAGRTVLDHKLDSIFCHRGRTIRRAGQLMKCKLLWHLLFNGVRR